MGFPLTQDAELDFDAYFALESEQRLAILLSILSPGITREGQEDLAVIRERITQKHHEILKLRKTDSSIPEPTLMQELFAALSTSVKSMQKISDAQKEQIAAHEAQQAQNPGVGEIHLVEEEEHFDSKKKTKRKKRHGCIIS